MLSVSSSMRRIWGDWPSCTHTSGTSATNETISEDGDKVISPGTCDSHNHQFSIVSSGSMEWCISSTMIGSPVHLNLQYINLPRK